MRALHLSAAVASLAVGMVLAATGAGQARSAMPERLSLHAPKPGHAQPLVAVVAENAGAETTDFTIPYGVLKDSGLFDVRAVSTGPGAIQLTSSLKVMADQTMAEFDARTPEGADIVIVPAQIDAKDPALKAWLLAQVRKGATVVSICEGARVLANAGLLDGKRATTHWRALPKLEKAYPTTQWMRDRRYVQDGDVISTTGVSASIPVSLALVEAQGGNAAAKATAARIGALDWSATHRTADFRISPLEYARAASAFYAKWAHETVEIPVADGEDEIALALKADAWARTFKTRVVTTNARSDTIRSAHGLTILRDDRPREGRFMVPARIGPALAQFDATLTDMSRRYGPFAARLARLGMEYDGSPKT